MLFEKIDFGSIFLFGNNLYMRTSDTAGNQILKSGKLATKRRRLTPDTDVECHPFSISIVNYSDITEAAAPRQYAALAVGSVFTIAEGGSYLFMKLSERLCMSVARQMARPAPVGKPLLHVGMASIQSAAEEKPDEKVGDDQGLVCLHDLRDGEFFQRQDLLVDGKVHLFIKVSGRKVVYMVGGTAETPTNSAFEQGTLEKIFIRKRIGITIECAPEATEYETFSELKIGSVFRFQTRAVNQIYCKLSKKKALCVETREVVPVFKYSVCEKLADFATYRSA